jgi:uncharacterized membrane protein HdeD (DUF308 family)
MFADAVTFLGNLLLSGALGVIALSILIVFASRSRKYRLLVITGCALLMGVGSIFFALFLALKSSWLPIILLGVIPLLVGCLGLFRLSKVDTRANPDAAKAEGKTGGALNRRDT